MDIQATKLELMQLLLQTEEKSLLEKVLLFFKEENKSEKKTITDLQKKETAIRIKAIENGTLKTRKWEVAKKEIFK